MNYEDKDKRTNPSNPASKKHDNKGFYSSEKHRDAKNQRQQDQPTKGDRDAGKTKGERPEYGSEGRANKSDRNNSRPNIKLGEKDPKGQQRSDKSTQGDLNWKKPR